MAGFSASTCFSPSCTSSTRKQPSHALRPSFLASLIASLSHLVAKLKPNLGGGSPHKFVSNVSHRARKMVHGRSRAAEVDQEREEAVWRRAILMGDKCQPLDFSGVIYYDQSGNQIHEPPPRSPRSPLPNYLNAA